MNIVTLKNWRIAITNLFYWISVYGFLPVLPFFYKQIGFSAQRVGLLIGAFSVGALLLRFISGKIADVIGCKSVSQLGIVVSLFAIGLYLCTSNWEILLFARFIHGVGSALYSSAAMTMVTLTNDKNDVKEAIALYTLSSMLGIGLATGTSYILYIHSSINMIMYLGVFFTLFTLILFPRRTIINISSEDRFNKQSFKNILLNYHIYRPTLNQFFVYFGYSSILIFFPIILSTGSAKSYLWLFYVCYSISVILARLSLKITTSTISSRNFAYIILFLIIMVLMLVALSHSVLTIIIIGICLGVSVGCAAPIFVSDITANTPIKIRGSAIGFFGTAIDLGMGAGPIFIGLLDKYLSYPWIFCILGGINLVNLVLFYIEK